MSRRTPEQAQVAFRHTPTGAPRAFDAPMRSSHAPQSATRELADRDRTILELREELQELRQQLSARDDFIATASHELRNPMAAVLMGVTNMLYMARSKREEVPPWLFARLEGLERQARSFVRRATTLLDATRLAAGRAAIDPSPLEMGPVVSGIVKELAPEAERAGSDLRADIQPGIEGSWDCSAIESIAVNLLSNAIKYGAGKPVSIAVSATDKLARIVVGDQGIGIASDDHARIFERFERASAPSDKPGFGVGLWIARQLARAHGGDIVVESSPGHGSIFTATLPRGIYGPPR